VKNIKTYFTLDNIILGIMFTFSAFWAAIFNSIDSPMQNQPIPVEIDLIRNLEHIFVFLIYFIQIFLTYSSFYCIYWVNHNVLINRIMAKYGVWNYLWLTILVMGCMTPILSCLTLTLPINSGEFTLLPSGNQDVLDIANYQVAFAIIFFSSPFILAFKWQKQEVSIAKLEQEKAQAELKWLQQQINPHFLFNTLNNVYSLTITSSEQAPDSILKLANLLRFVVYQGGKERVYLKDELNYLRDYIALQKLRVGHKARITFKHDEKLLAQDSWCIAPLLLIIPIENAFKHGVDISDRPSWCSIKITIKQKQLVLSCTNSISQDTRNEDSLLKPLKSDNVECGLGLENLKRRLELMYKDKFTLKILATEHVFRTELMIELESDENIKRTYS